MDTLKKKARKLQAKTGMSYQAAVNQLRGAQSSTSAELAPVTDRTAELLGKAVHASSILVWELPAVGRSHDPAVARQTATDRATRPKYAARTGGLEVEITRQDFDELRAAGATDVGRTQVIRLGESGRSEYSVQCATCQRWICSRHEKSEGLCACGQPFEIEFENRPEPKGAYGPVCMECGCDAGLTEVSEGRNPWHVVSIHQEICRRCQESATRPRRPFTWRGSKPASRYLVNSTEVVEATMPSEAVVAVLRRRLRKNRLRSTDVTWTVRGDSVASGECEGMQISAVLMSTG